jgi:hypothetical protein
MEDRQQVDVKSDFSSLLPVFAPKPTIAAGECAWNSCMNRWYFGTIGTGPAGELRYPPYDSHDSGSGWPNRGFFQAYVRAAIAFHGA